MGLLSWLFGLSAAHQPQTRVGDWQTSERGNSTAIIGRERVTVFPQDGGFKFCVARAGRDHHDPYFSELYASETHAREAGLAYVSGHESPHRSMTSAWRNERRQRSRLLLGEAVGRLNDLAAATDQARNITELQKVARRLASTIAQLSNQLSRILHDDLSEKDVNRAEDLKHQAERQLATVQALIAHCKKK